MNAINLYECYEHGEYSFTLRDRFIHSPQVERALTRLPMASRKQVGRYQNQPDLPIVAQQGGIRLVLTQRDAR